MLLRAVLVSSIAACAFACGRVAPVGAGGGAALMRNVMRSRSLEVVAEERELHEALQRAAARLRAADESSRFDAVVTEGFPDRGRTTPRIVVGTRKSNRAWLLAQHTGVMMDREGAVPSFRFADETYADPGDAFVATFEDPERPGLPVTLVFANAIETAAVLCESLQPAWKPGISIMRGSSIVRTGVLRLDGTVIPYAWRSEARARAARLSVFAPVAGGPPGFELRSQPGLAPDVLARYVESCTRSTTRARSWIGSNEMSRNLVLRVWSQPSEYLVDGDPNALSRCDAVLGETDALILDRCDDGGAGVARAIAWAALGAPAEPWMSDAAGVEAAWSWWGRDLDPWIARIAGGGRTVRIADLVAPGTDRALSRHVLVPLRAALWRFLRENSGEAFVREIWRGTRSLAGDPAEDAAFSTWIRARAAVAKVDEPRRQAARARDREFSVLHGIGACEFEPVDGRLETRGLASREFALALDDASAIGADALLVTAWAVDRPAAPARFGASGPDLVSSREGDVRVAAALLAGSARGMRTVLAAHLLAGEGGSWSGSWTRGQESGWIEFFEIYSNFVEHHAALAELTGATGLSIGTGLADVTGTAPVGRRPNPLEAGWKSAGWSRVIGAARRAFDGFLTYTAGSTLELERVPFYGDLDFVALELSPTLELDDLDDAVDARVEIGTLLEHALRALELKARETGKRILFTEVCFSPALDGAAGRLMPGHTSIDWHAQQFLDFSERLRTWSGTPLVAGVFAWRFGVSGEEPAYATVIDTPRVRDAVRMLYRSLPAR